MKWFIIALVIAVLMVLSRYFAKHLRNDELLDDDYPENWGDG